MSDERQKSSRLRVDTVRNITMCVVVVVVVVQMHGNRLANSNLIIVYMGNIELRGAGCHGRDVIFGNSQNGGKAKLNFPLSANVPIDPSVGPFVG